jgi:acyl carrier protein phosphodiesterase
MNYLAHIYLSGEDSHRILGNFIGDEVKGNSYQEFPISLQRGILLHRAIDTYTDTHPIVRQSTKRLHPYYSHYSGVIVDIFYDHYLAHNWKNYSSIPLSQFASDFYQLAQENLTLLPEKIQQLLPYMISGNWLVSYATLEGIDEVLHNMNRRTGYRSGMDTAGQELRQYYEEFKKEFEMFFEDLQAYAAQKITELSV